MAKRKKQGNNGDQKPIHEVLKDMENRLSVLENREIITGPCPACKKHGKPTGLMIDVDGGFVLDHNRCTQVCQSCNGTKEVKNV